MKINSSLASLPAGYLFAEIAKRVKEYSAAHPDADILRLGIGDVTRPLVPAVVEEMKRAASFALADLVAPEELTDKYILPLAFDKRIGPAVAAAVAKAARDSGVARL